MIPAEGEEDRNRHGNRGGRTGGVWELLRGRMLGVWRALGVSAVGEGEAWVRLYPTCDVLLASVLLALSTIRAMSTSKEGTGGGFQLLLGEHMG